MKSVVSGMVLLLILIGSLAFALGVTSASAQGGTSSIATSVSCSPNPAHFNSPVTCTAIIPIPYATGTVDWTSNSSTGSFNPSVCTVSSGNSSAIVETYFSDSVLGTVSITASYSGDSFNMPSNGSTVLVVGQEEQSSTHVYCSFSVVPVLFSVFCTAWVSGFNPSRNVVWSSNSSTGSFSSSSCALLSGECSTTYTDSVGGTVVITAVYSGDSCNTPSNGNTTLVVSEQFTQSCTYIYCEPSSVPVGGSVDCIAEISGLNPTGTVTFSSNSSTGSFSPSACSISSGNCATTYTDNCMGNVLISASYSGDLFNVPSNGSKILKIVQALQSSVYVRCEPSTIAVNGSVSCTALVSGFNPSGFNPGGIVTWSSNSSTGCFSSTICPVSPVATSWYFITEGACSTTYTDSSAGTVFITATYGGDGENMPSSASTILTVTTLAQQSSTYVILHYLQSVPGSARFNVHINASVVCWAIVSGQNLTGTVSWSSNSSTGSFSNYGFLNFGLSIATYSDSSAGTVLITASYSGDSENTPSNGSEILFISGQSERSSVSVFCSPDPVHVNESVICTAFVSAANVYDANFTLFSAAHGPPTISNVSQVPDVNNINYSEPVVVSANVTDNSGTGIANVTIVSSFDDWTTNSTAPMTLNITTGFYEGTLPAYNTSAITVLDYTIQAYDNSGGFTELAPYISVAVFPEYAAPSLVLIIIAMSAVAILIARKKHGK